MDKKTFDALKKIINFAKNASTPTDHADAHYTAFTQVEGWMDEVEKEIEDLETLGTDTREPLTPIK